MRFFLVITSLLSLTLVWLPVLSAAEMEANAAEFEVLYHPEDIVRNEYYPNDVWHIQTDDNLLILASD